MVLDLAVKAVFPVPVAIVTTSGVSSVGARRSGSLTAVPALESVVPFVLEGRHFVLGVFLVVLVFGLTVVLDGRNWFDGFQSGLPLSIGGHLIHVIQRHRGWIVLGKAFLRSPGREALKSCILKNCSMLLAVSLVHCFAVFSNRPTCPSP
jgi:hypothetical protein